MGGRAASLVEEWTARARAALAEVNSGVRATFERLHEGEDLVLDEAFGAMTSDEKLELEREKEEVRQLERKAREERPAPEPSKRDPLWGYRRRMRGGP